MGCMHGVTIGCHTSCYNVHQVYSQTTTGCNTDRYNSSVMYTRPVLQPVVTLVLIPINQCIRSFSHGATAVSIKV